MYHLQQCVENLKQQLKKWNNEEFRNIFWTKSNILDRMKQIQQNMITHGRTDELIEEETKLKAQISICDN
jgi:hypothetical protein